MPRSLRAVCESRLAAAGWRRSPNVADLWYHDEFDAAPAHISEAVWALINHEDTNRSEPPMPKLPQPTIELERRLAELRGEAKGDELDQVVHATRKWALRIAIKARRRKNASGR